MAQQVGGIGSFERHLQTGILTWTPEMESIYGLPAGVFGGTRAAFENLVHPDDRARVVELVERALHTGAPTHGEWRAIWPDGSVHWIAGRWQLLTDHSGTPSRVIGVNMEITERKKAEEELRASEERLRLAQSAAHIGTFELNLRTGFDIWPPETEALYGLPPGGFGRTLTAFEDLIHPNDRERVKGLTQQMMRTEQTTEAEWRVIWPDGSVHWIAARCQVLPEASGERSRVIGVNMDVTERKHAEEALRENEEKFRSVFRDAGVGMVIVSPEGRFLAVNGTFCDYLGYTEEELLSKTVESVTFSEDWPDFSRKLGEAITEGIGLRRFEKRCLHKSGRIVYTESTACLIRNPDGEPQYFVGGVLDVTTRKESEQTVSEMTRKLVEAQEKERARIARELHDDINQRLAMLAVELQQLKENPSEVESRVQELRKNVAELSNDVQAMSHDLHSSKLEYLGVVAGMKSWCKEFGERQKIQIDCTHDVRSTLSIKLGLCLFRVLQEALHNAAKYSRVKQVEVQLHELSGEIHLIIRDSGKGFDVEAALQGKGLGLTSMRERVRLVKGTITIESKPMAGTTIHVRVPFGLEQSSQQEAV